MPSDADLDGDVLTAFGSVAPNSTEVFEEEMPRDGRITGLYVNTFVGQETDLRYSFEIDTGDNVYNLLQFMGEEYIAGNGEDFPLPVSKAFNTDDTLRIKVENVETEQTYTANGRIHIAYGMGAWIVRLKELLNRVTG